VGVQIQPYLSSGEDGEGAPEHSEGASNEATEQDLHEQQGGGGQAADGLSCKKAMRERMEHRERERQCRK